MRTLFCLLGVLAFSATGVDVSIQPSPLEWAGSVAGYDPFAPSEQSAVLKLQVRGLKEGIQAVELEDWTREGAAHAGGAALRFEWRDLSGRRLPETERGAVQLSRLPSGVPAPETLSVRLAFPAGQVVPPGMYRIQGRIRLQPSEAGGRALESRPWTVQIPVLQVADLSLTPPGGHPDFRGGGMALDLGEIEQGQAAHCELHVRSNVRLGLLIESENGGRLRPRSGAGEAGIPYQLWVGGSAVPLHGKSPVEWSLPVTAGGKGIKRLLQVIPGDASGLPSGRYQDTIILTIIPQD